MTIKKVLGICGAILFLSILIEVFFVHHHVYYWYHGLIGFDMIFGFVGCAAIIVFAKFLGKLFIEREENYYLGGEDDHD